MQQGLLPKDLVETVFNYMSQEREDLIDSIELQHQVCMITLWLFSKEKENKCIPFYKHVKNGSDTTYRFWYEFELLYRNHLREEESRKRDEAELAIPQEFRSPLHIASWSCPGKSDMKDFEQIAPYPLNDTSRPFQQNLLKFGMYEDDPLRHLIPKK